MQQFLLIAEQKDEAKQPYQWVMTAAAGPWTYLACAAAAEPTLWHTLIPAKEQLLAHDMQLLQQ